MTLIRDTGVGKFDADVAQVMTEVRQPVFVDNAVHHALVNSQSSSKHKVTIENRNNATYAVATENTFNIVEGESSIQVTHSRKPGHSSTAAPFFEDEQLSSITKIPSLLYNEDDHTQRLSPSTIESATHGVKMNLRNMKGTDLQTIGFNGSDVHFGHPVDVGLRTSDLAIRLGTDITDSLTSVSLGSSINTVNTNTERRKYSTKFLAEDFNGVSLSSALRFTSRHDGRIVYVDRFANLLYTPLDFSETSRYVDASIRIGAKEVNPVDDTENRITLVGIPFSLNEVASVTMNDGERQQGKYNSDIKENSSPIFDATVKSNAAARRVARQILKANSLTKGAIDSAGHLDCWDLRPGKIVDYAGSKKVIMEAKHVMSQRTTDFTFLSLEKGVEGVLQGIGHGMVAAASGKNTDQTSQILNENITLFDSVEIVITPRITLRGIEDTKFLIGPAGNRGALGGANKAIGSGKKMIIYGGV